HHGVVHATGGDRFPGGCAAGAVSGTSWHGLLENDGFRRAYLHQAASTAGRGFLPGQMSFQARREQQLDILGDLITGHTDTAALLRLIEQGAPPGLPFIPPGAP
ncbi:MAG TPA: cobyric acid synthase CobQ, partial [Streptosporangiaceae bacterium]|nr:cobyric acid synthase CobQ [Streptosporangiaceae bacterium]